RNQPAIEPDVRGRSSDSTRTAYRRSSGDSHSAAPCSGRQNAFHLRLDGQEDRRGSYSHRSCHRTPTGERVPRAKGASTQMNDLANWPLWQLMKRVAAAALPACVALLTCTGLANAQIYGPPQTQTYAPARLLQKVGI